MEWLMWMGVECVKYNILTHGGGRHGAWVRYTMDNIRQGCLLGMTSFRSLCDMSEDRERV